MAVNLGYGTEPAKDVKNPTATRLAEIEVVNGGYRRDTNPGIIQ